MEPQNQQDKKDIEKISTLNTIFEELITDASDLVKDLYWGVKTYLLFGLMTIPLFIGAVLLFSGFAQILNYFRLRSKYSRLFRVQSELKKS
jgi:hypothetical protein